MSLRKLRKLERTIRAQGPQARIFSFDRETINETDRTIEISFSSETRDVIRWFGIEVLGHDPAEVRMQRINTAGPLLMDHNTRDQVGVIEKAWIDGGTRKGRALVRFGKSVRAQEIWQDVIDGIRSNISFAYDIYKFILEEEGKNGQPDVLRAIDWEPLEISIVSVPADISVGVGRSQSGEPREIEVYQYEQTNERGDDTPMKCNCGRDLINGICGHCEAERARNTIPLASVTINADQERAAERGRIREIQACAGAFTTISGIDELARQFVDNGQGVAEFNAAVLAKMRGTSSAQPIPLAAPVDIQLNDTEDRQYSVLRAISIAAGIREAAGIEMDVHQEICRKLGRSTKGMFIPMSLRAIPGQRTPITTVTTGPGGGYSVATELRDMIEILRAKMLVRRMGAQVLSGLTSNVAFPRQTGTGTLYWTGENAGADVTESNASLDQVTLTPKTAQGTQAYSRQLLQQSSIDVEMFTRNDLSAIGALGLDFAAINGSGSSNQPRGILNTSGIGSVAGGTNGALPTYANMVALEASVATANADVGNMGYLSNTKVRGILKTTQRFASTDTPIWTDSAENDFGLVNGYRAGATSQIPSTLTKGTATSICSAVVFGNWNDLLIGEFGVMEILADPYSKKKQGLIEATMIMMCDIAVRHPASFSAMVDALTTGF